ncbi:MAG: hypothetical protein D3921_13435 [Candidatus Electrothrix sp. AW1]|nr:hypothetical protein [Candidatus Electrothrix sp. AX1]MCI5183494.1 hypothetical protein [Candidatus Electrothrix gigas]
MLSSFGILGTFTGIAIGLAKFNVKKIDASIPYLLDGMNTAFITSIFGIIFGLLVKIILSLSTAPKRITTEQIGAAHIHEAIKEQTQQLVQIQASIAKQSKVISKATNYLHKDFQEFAQQISEISSKHLIEALENVIRDFNSKITEQFGENFKRLDDSVGKLLLWQSEYKDQMIDMKKGLENAVKIIEDSRTALSEISKEAESIPNLMEYLKSILATTNGQLNSMNSHLETFEEMRNKAVQAMPQFYNQIEEVQKSITDSVQTASNHYQNLLTGSKTLITNFTQSTANFQQQFIVDSTNWRKLLSTSLIESTRQISQANQETSAVLKEAGNNVANSSNATQEQLVLMVQNLESSLIKHKEHIDTFVQNIGTEINRLVSDNSYTVNKQVEKTVNTLGSSLEEHTDNLDNFVSGTGEKIQELVKTSFNEQHREVQDLGNALSNEIKSISKTRQDYLTKEMSAFDKAMQDEIHRLMEMMGNSLINITDKFVEDYTDLTTKMQQIVRKADSFSSKPN